MNNKDRQKQYRKNKQKLGYKYFSVMIPEPLYIQFKTLYLEWKMSNLKNNNDIDFSIRFKFKNLKSGTETVCTIKELANNYNLNYDSIYKIVSGDRVDYKKWICMGQEVIKKDKV